MGFLVTSLTKALLPRLLSLAKLLPFKNDEATVFLGTFNGCRHFLLPFPRSHGLMFPLTCTVNCGTLYRQVCAFPIHIQSIKFGLKSSCKNISSMFNGNRMHRSSISNLIAKGLNTYVNKVYIFFMLNTFARILKTCFPFVIMGYCVYFAEEYSFISSIFRKGCNVTKCGKSQGV
jgi:hypothetical protein